MESGEVALDLSMGAGQADGVVPLGQGSTCTALFSALEFGDLTAIKLRLVRGRCGGERGIHA